MNMLGKILLISTISVMAFSVSACGEKESSENGKKEKIEMAQVGHSSIPSNWRELHEGFFTIDSHVDISYDYTFKPEYDPGSKTGMQVDLPKMRAGGLDGAMFVVYTGQTKRTPEGYAKAKKTAFRRFEAIRRMALELYPDQIGLAGTADEAEKINASGKKVAMIGIENGYVIGKDLSLVKTYYDLGGRYMTLAHMGHNDICDSSIPKTNLGDETEEHGGLSDFGKKVIDEMNRYGMMVDVSHVSVKCMMQATAYSKAPPIASHSSVRALADHPRNMTDEQMKTLAEKGGVMQIVALGGYVKVDKERRVLKNKLREGIVKAQGGKRWSSDKYGKLSEYTKGMAAIEKSHPRATVADYVEHILYAVGLIGIDHVGIVSDFDGGGGVEGWDDASETANVTKEMFKRGLSKEDIAKIWSGNILRLMRANEQVAAEISAQ
jgi:membrane dipeptidase